MSKKKKLFKKGDKIYVPAVVEVGYEETEACIIRLLFNVGPFYIRKDLAQKCIMR